MGISGGNMKDRVQAANSYSRREWATNIPEIDIARQKVLFIMSRKRKEDTAVTEIEKKRIRVERRENCLNNVSWDQDRVPSLLPTIDDDDDDDEYILLIEHLFCVSVCVTKTK